MAYEFYADVYVLTNFYMDFLAIYAVGEVLGQKKRRLRYVIGSMLCSLLSCVLFLGIKNVSVYQMCMHLILNPTMIVFCFFSSSFEIYLKAYFLMYFITMILGGSMDWLYVNVSRGRYYEACLLLAGVPILVFLFILRWKRSFANSIYLVSLSHRGKQVELQALYDTGNRLRDPYVRKPVHVISKEVYMDLGGTQMFLSRLVPFSSVGKENGMLETITIEKMRIIGNDSTSEYEEVVLAVAENSIFKNRNYQMILNSSVGEKIERKEEKICT